MVNYERHGVGELTWKDGKAIRGLFENNQAHGVMLTTYSDKTQAKNDYAHLNGKSFF
jgi:hypothetical protein